VEVVVEGVGPEEDLLRLGWRRGAAVATKALRIASPFIRCEMPGVALIRLTRPGAMEARRAQRSMRPKA
jgi:hypothetical protein